VRAPGRILSPGAAADTAAKQAACGLQCPRQAQTFPVSGNSPLDCRSEFRGTSSCHREVPRSDRMQGPPLGGLLLSGLIALQRVDDSQPACRHCRRRHCAFSRGAESLVVGVPKLVARSQFTANQAGLPTVTLPYKGSAPPRPAPDRHPAICREAAPSVARCQRVLRCRIMLKLPRIRMPLPRRGEGGRLGDRVR